MGALAFSFNDVFAANDNFAYYNRLIKATKLDGTVLDFRYDGDGLRMESIKNGGAIDANYQISGGTRTRYVTSATEEIADISGARVVLARYIAGPAIDERIAQVDANGAVKYIHTDKQNSVVAISNSSGAVISRRGYGSYGETTATQLASNDNSPTHPFGYTGRRWDADLGLYYYRARWYDPELGTFLETDPIGSLDYINLYSYVGLDPMNATDPSGKYTCKVKEVCNAVSVGLAQIKEVQAKFKSNSNEYRNLGNVLNAYGRQGERNGVVISSLIPRDGALGSVERVGGNIEVRFNFALMRANIHGKTDNIGGLILAGTIAHEGMHVWQRQHGIIRENSSYNELVAAERSAYQTETYIYLGFGIWGANMSRLDQERFINEGATMSAARYRD